MKYRQEYEGEWVWPVRKGYKMGCCDCGLVHRVDFALVRYGNGRRIVLRAWRDERATAAKRRERRKREARGA